MENDKRESLVFACPGSHQDITSEVGLEGRTEGVRWKRGMGSAVTWHGPLQLLLNGSA